MPSARLTYTDSTYSRVDFREPRPVRNGFHARATVLSRYNQWFQSPLVWNQLNSAVKYRENDIIIATHPKAGTTWTEQIVLLLLAGGDESRVSSRRRHMPAFTDECVGGKLFVNLLQYHALSALFLGICSTPTTCLRFGWSVIWGSSIKYVPAEFPFT